MKPRRVKLQETGLAIARVFLSAAAVVIVIVVRRKGNPGCIMSRNDASSKGFFRSSDNGLSIAFHSIYACTSRIMISFVYAKLLEISKSIDSKFLVATYKEICDASVCDTSPLVIISNTINENMYS